jgi:predicted DNA-binding ribbon-helix-helix protein
MRQSRITGMRTTIAIDDDVFQHARRLAQERRVSIGAAVSTLLREGIRAQQHPQKSAKNCKTPYGLLPARDEIITSEHVRRLMDQEGI